MKSRDAAREITAALGSGIISPKLAREIGLALAARHAADQQFDFARYGTKLAMRHAKRPGRRRNPERDERIRDAVKWAKFNRAALGKEEAIKRAAQQFSVPPNVVTNAYEGHVQKFRGLRGPKSNCFGRNVPKPVVEDDR